MIEIPTWKKILITSTVLVALLAGIQKSGTFSPQADPDVPSSFITVSGDELLDQIFEEEKSDRVCRFIKNRKMKA